MSAARICAPPPPPGFAALVVEHRPALLRHALKLTRDRDAAEDLVQDALVSALGSVASFTPGTNIAAWLQTIVKHRFIASRRPLRARAAHISLDAEQGEGVSLIDMLGAAPGSQMDRLLLRDTVRAMARLPAIQRDALLGVMLGDRPYAEVAAEAGCPEGTIKSRVFRAHRSLNAAVNQGAAA